MDALEAPLSEERPLLGRRHAAPECVVHRGGRPPVLRWPHIVQLAAVTALGAASSDAYVPLLPEIQRELRASVLVCSLSLQLNWIANGVASSAWGALSDVIGRKRALVAALSTFCVGTAACAASTSVATLVFGRVLQGVGEGSAQLPVAVVRDAFTDDRACNRVIASIMQITPVVIVTAPAFGGWIGGLLGWRWVFGALLVWGVLNLAGVIAFIPETLGAAQAVPHRARPRRAGGVVGMGDEKPQKRTTSLDGDDDRAHGSVGDRKPGRLVHESSSSPPPWGYLAVIACFYGVVGTVLTALPYELESHFRASSQTTGLWMGSIGIAGFVGSTLNRQLTAAAWSAASVTRLLRGAMAWYSTLCGVVGAFAWLRTESIGEHVLYTMLAVYALVGTQFFAIPAATALMLGSSSDDDLEDQQRSGSKTSRTTTRAGLVAGMSGTANLVAIAMASFTVSICGGAVSSQSPHGYAQPSLGAPYVVWRLLFAWSALAAAAYWGTRWAAWCCRSNRHDDDGCLSSRRRRRTTAVQPTDGPLPRIGSSSEDDDGDDPGASAASFLGGAHHEHHLLGGPAEPVDDALSVISEDDAALGDHRLLDDDTLHRLLLRGASSPARGSPSLRDGLDSDQGSVAQDVATI